MELVFTGCDKFSCRASKNTCPPLFNAVLRSSSVVVVVLTHPRQWYRTIVNSSKPSALDALSRSVGFLGPCSSLWWLCALLNLMSEWWARLRLFPFLPNSEDCRRPVLLWSSSSGRRGWRGTFSHCCHRQYRYDATHRLSK